MKYDKKLFSERLVKAINNSYQTQAEIARRAGIHKGTLSMYCLGKKTPSPKTLIALCVVLDCSPEWLTEGKGSIKDKFNFAKIPSQSVGKLEASRIDDFVEIRFMVPQKDFRTFFIEAERNNCLT